MNALEKFQHRILGPTEPIPYTDLLKMNYPKEAFMSEPFIGLRFLVRDYDGTELTDIQGKQRLDYLDKEFEKIIRNRGVIVRESSNDSIYNFVGFWFVSMPVPRSQSFSQLENIIKTLTLAENFNVFRDGLCEINISVRFPVNEVFTRLNYMGDILSQEQKEELIQPNNSACRFGTIVPINPNYTLLRTRWRFDINNTSSVESINADNIQKISSLILLLSALFI